jgi:hypothetical protein
MTSMLESERIALHIRQVENLLPWLDRLGHVELAAYRRRQLPRLEAARRAAIMYETWEAQNALDTESEETE